MTTVDPTLEQDSDETIVLSEIARLEAEANGPAGASRVPSYTTCGEENFDGHGPEDQEGIRKLLDRIQRLQARVQVAEDRSPAGAEQARPGRDLGRPSVSTVSEPYSGRVPGLKPEPYDGTTVWEDYYRRFERLASLHQWNDTARLQCLLVSLTGSAQQYVDDIDLEGLDYAACCQILGSRFGAAKDVEIHRATLKSRVRKPNEDLYALGQDIRRLMRLAYPGGGSNLASMEVDAFVNAQTYSRLKEAIYATNPASLDQAIQTAVWMDSFFKAEKQSRDFNRVRQLKEGPPVPVRQETRRCFRCGEAGHLVKECPKPPQPRPPNTAWQRRPGRPPPNGPPGNFQYRPPGNEGESA